MKLCPNCGFSNNDKDKTCQNCYTNIEKETTYDQNKKPNLITKTYRTRYINIPFSKILGISLILFKIADYFTDFSLDFPLLTRIFMTIVYIYIGLIIIKSSNL